LHCRWLKCYKKSSGATEAFTREIDEFENEPRWFYEYRVEATADSTQFCGGAPVAFAAANSFGINYHIFQASDGLEFSQDFFPIFFPLEEGVPHTIRLELDNVGEPSFKWFIDGEIALEGAAEGPFPVNSPRVTWHGRSWQIPTLNTWDYVRYGTLPTDASADFNSDGSVDHADVFFIAECIDRSAAGESAEPSCTWADMNGDDSVDCSDWDIIKQDSWTGPPVDPPLMTACGEGAIPAVSNWGTIAMIGLTLCLATTIYRRRPAGA